MFKGGRPKDRIWEHFESVVVNGKQLARCKSCGNQQGCKPYRLREHFKKCSSQSDASVDQGRKRPRDDSPPPTKRQALDPIIQVQPQIADHVFKTSSSDRSTLDMEIARLFYSCNIPFSVADHPQFKKVIQLLRPGYKPPTRKVIAGPLLDTVHEDLCKEMRKEIDGKTATLVEDGWSNQHNEPIVATSLQIQDKCYYLDSHSTESMTKSSENCKKTNPGVNSACQRPVQL